MGRGKDRRYRKDRADSLSDSSDSSPKRRRSRSRSKERSRRRHRRSRSRSYERKERRRRSRSRSRSPYRRKEKKRDRDRERNRERDRDRGRDRDRDRDRDRERNRDNDRGKDRDRDRSGHEKDNSQALSVRTKEERERQIKEELEKAAESSLEAAKKIQEGIENEMKKRRERLDAWRQKLQEEEDTAPTEEMDTGKKKWSLEDEEEDDEDDVAVPLEQKANGEVKGDAEKGEKMEEEEDVDPLDAFMVAVQAEVKQINSDFQKKTGTQISSVVGSKAGSKMVTVTKVKQEKAVESKPQQIKDTKGELLHNDQDAMEYSEEEEEGDEELVSVLKTIAKKSKGKDLPKVDHKNVEYKPFRKDFYVEVPELTRMSNEEVQAYRTELENIKVKGKRVPAPVRTWAQCGLAAKVLDVMKKQNYEKPTPIQAQAIPAIMSGRDLIGIAKTGSGKTLAFLLPMFRHVLDQPPLEPEDGPIAVILTPTRELAIQIYNDCRKFTKVLKLWSVCVYGGTGISEQIADLKRGAEIVVCTPGRMIDMLAANSGRVTNLRRTTYLVLDEADRMFDMGFEPQVMKIIGNIRPDRQTVLFSATFPRQMEALARKILTKPVEVQVGGRSVVCKDVNQSVIVIEDHQKFFKLLELLGIYYEQGSVLVFVERQEAADALIRDLMKSSYSCMALHGGMDQFDRDSTISDFKNGNIKILVATSVAARGLDVKQLILVVNYDCPNHYEDYVHRCGRTGRAGNKGFAYTFLTPDQEKLAGDIIKALELSGASVPEELESMWQKYMEKLKAQGKIKALKSGKVVPIIKKKKAIGFTGKGFKFDEKEAVKDAETKLKQKSHLGYADDDDEDKFALITIDKKLDEIFGNKVTVHDPNAPVLPSPGFRIGGAPNAPQTDLLKQATAIATEIMMKKNKTIAQQPPKSGPDLAAQQAASSIMKGGDFKVSGAVLASQIAASINAKVGAAPAKAQDTILPIGTVLPGQQKDQSEQNTIKYSDEVEINSFPQQIRFRITTREVLDEIGEFADCYISVRGIYVPESREPKDGEKRLFLSLEAKSERAIQVSKQEIKRVIKEEAQRMASRIKPHQQSGRYSVL